MIIFPALLLASAGQKQQEVAADMQILTTPQRYCADGVRLFAKRALVVGNEITNIYVHEFIIEDEGRSGRQFRGLTGRGKIPCGNNGY
ncbi:MAG: hypothetical protein ACRCR6_02740 [Plesiomonas sp.]